MGDFYEITEFIIGIPQNKSDAYFDITIYRTSIIVFLYQIFVYSMTL